MKTQNFGAFCYLNRLDIYCNMSSWPMEVLRDLFIENSREGALTDYESKRINVCGDAKNDVKQQSIPADGKYTMIKCGVLEGDYYQWECRYDEGPGDKKWMEEQDKIYITQLKEKSKNNNKLTEQEQLDLKEVEEKEEKENGGAADGWYNKGDVLVDQGQSEEAAKCYNESQKLAPKKFPTRISKANNINKADTNGLTVLHHAVKKGFTDIVKHLLDNKADVLVLTNDGLTAYDIAVTTNQSLIIKILQENSIMKSILQQIEELKKTTEEQQQKINNLTNVVENQKVKIDEQKKQLDQQKKEVDVVLKEALQKETNERKKDIEKLQQQTDKLEVSGGNSLESAIDKKDIPEIEKMLANASGELLKGLNLIPIAHSLKPEKIPPSSISTVEQLIKATDQALQPNQVNVKSHLKRLAKGMNKTLELWRSGKLENKAAVKSLDEIATVAFMELLKRGGGIEMEKNGNGLSLSIRKLHQEKLDSDHKQLWSKWVKKQLPIEQMKKIDEHVEKELWVSWIQTEKKENPLATILENYEENTLLNLLIKQGELPQTLISSGLNDYKEKIIKNVSNILLSTMKQSKVPASLKGTLVQLVKEARLEKEDEFISVMDPIFEVAISRLLSQASQGKLDNSKEALQALQGIFKQAIAEQKIEGNLKTYLRQEAVKNLVKDYKEGKLTDLEGPTMEAKTKLIINHMKPTSEENEAGFKQVLDDLKQGKIKNLEADELFLQITPALQEKLKALNEMTNPMAKIIKLEEKMKNSKFNWDNNSITTFSNNTQQSAGNGQKIVDELKK